MEAKEWNSNTSLRLTFYLKLFLLEENPVV